jgi:hypothetical protein
MKPNTLLSVALLSFLIGAAHSEESLSPAAFFGSWRATAQHPSGARIATSVQFKPNLQFSASATVNDAPFLQASGTWRVSGKTLEWHYIESSHPSIPKGLIDVDDIEGIGPQELRLKSRMSGRLTIYSRVK